METRETLDPMAGRTSHIATGSKYTSHVVSHSRERDEACRVVVQRGDVKTRRAPLFDAAHSQHERRVGIDAGWRVAARLARRQAKHETPGRSLQAQP
jgi:hypothetical protein